MNLRNSFFVILLLVGSIQYGLAQDIAIDGKQEIFQVQPNNTVENAQSKQVRVPDLHKINQYKKSLQKNLKVHSLIRFTLDVGIPLLTMYSIYRWWNHIPAKENGASQEVPAVDPVSTEGKTVLAKLSSLFTLDYWKETGKSVGNGIISGSKSAFHAVISPKSWLNGAAFVGKHGLNIGATAAANQFLNQTKKQYQHPQTLQWFITTHISYKQTMQELQLYLQIFEQTTINSLYFDVACTSACDSLINQLEHIIAFMEFKTEKLSDDKQEEAQAIAYYLLNYGGMFAEQINTLFVADSQEKKQLLPAYINSFELQLDREIMHFSRLELDDEDLEALLKGEHHESHA